MKLRPLLIFCLSLLVSPFNSTAQERTAIRQSGKASFYHDDLSGRKTGSGEMYRTDDFTAAHRTLPFNSYVLVTNKLNGRTAVVRINDRGPFKKQRIIDVSKAAAMKLGMVSSGLAPVQLTLLKKLDPLEFNDTLFASGECRDWHGAKTDTVAGPTLNVWSTSYWKHAFYIASQLVLETGNDRTFVCAFGEGKGRTYTVRMNVDSDAIEVTLHRLKAEGFFNVRLND